MKSHLAGLEAVLFSAILMTIALFSAACVESGEGDELTTDRAESERSERGTPISDEERIRIRREAEERRAMKRLDQHMVTDAEDTVSGEVPGDLLDKIYADLEQRLGAARTEFALLTSESVQWPDGSLGCPEPGQMYTQAVVSGYRVVIGHGDKKYDYRSSERGYFVLCSDPRAFIDKIREKEKGPQSGAPVQ